MGEQIFGKEQGQDQGSARGSSDNNGRALQPESETPEKDGSEPSAAEAADDDPYQCFASAAGRPNESGSGYAVTAAVAPAGSGRGEEEGRRWHDLVSVRLQAIFCVCAARMVLCCQGCAR